MQRSSDEEDGTTSVTMTESVILRQCKMQQGYSTPELNERLYLHHCGFARLGGLTAFTGCVVLYLDHNALSDLSGLCALTKLDSLYLSFNALSNLDSLPHLPALHTLDVASNQLTSVGGLDEAAPALQTLLAGHNRLQSLSGVQGLRSLLSIDVSYNRISNEEATELELRSHRATLRTLLLHGNEVCRRSPQYRKRWIAAFSALRFLDDYPVFEDERERAVAFERGGATAEAEVRSAQVDRAAAGRQDQFAYYGGLRDTQREARRRNGVETRPTAYFRTHNLPPEDDNVAPYIPQPRPASHADPCEER